MLFFLSTTFAKEKAMYECLSNGSKLKRKYNFGTSKVNEALLQTNIASL